jgi:hypothetical protein
MPNHVAEPEIKQTSHPGESDNRNVSPSAPQKAEGKPLTKGFGLLTLEQVADDLNEDKRIIEYQRKLGELVAVDVNGEYHYPAWQFQNGKLLTGLDRVLAALEENGLSPEGKVIFLTAKNRALDDKTAIECLQNGDVSIDEVVMVASRHGLHCG